jgi:hypothetical protein
VIDLPVGLELEFELFAREVETDWQVRDQFEIAIERCGDVPVTQVGVTAEEKDRVRSLLQAHAFSGAIVRAVGQRIWHSGDAQIHHFCLVTAGRARKGEPLFAVAGGYFGAVRCVCGHKQPTPNRARRGDMHWVGIVAGTPGG